MFVAAVCFMFLIKLKWPKNKNTYKNTSRRYRKEAEIRMESGGSWQNQRYKPSSQKSRRWIRTTKPLLVTTRWFFPRVIFMKISCLHTTELHIEGDKRQNTGWNRTSLKSAKRLLTSCELMSTACRTQTNYQKSQRGNQTITSPVILSMFMSNPSFGHLVIPSPSLMQKL